MKMKIKNLEIYPSNIDNKETNYTYFDQIKYLNGLRRMTKMVNRPSCSSVYNQHSSIKLSEEQQRIRRFAIPFSLLPIHVRIKFYSIFINKI